jgi:hypothetical protein
MLKRRETPGVTPGVYDVLREWKINLVIYKNFDVSSCFYFTLENGQRK